jgi:hypothetical protein
MDNRSQKTNIFVALGRIMGVLPVQPIETFIPNVLRERSHDLSNAASRAQGLWAATQQEDGISNLDR